MSAELFAVLATVVIAHFIALVSPGPDFLLVVKSAVKNRRKVALGVAAGIAVANGIYIALCIVGVGAVISTSLIAMRVLKALGGAFLVYLAWHALRARKSDYSALAAGSDTTGTAVNGSFLKEFAVGFLSGITNPKNILFYLSLFSVVLTEGIGLEVKVGLGLWMTMAVFAWDSFIILVLANPRVKRVFARVAYYVDKTAGAILGAVGLGLLWSAATEGDIRT